jgi:hypothetical protein
VPDYPLRRDLHSIIGKLGVPTRLNVIDLQDSVLQCHKFSCCHFLLSFSVNSPYSKYPQSETAESLEIAVKPTNLRWFLVEKSDFNVAKKEGFRTLTNFVMEF